MQWAAAWGINRPLAVMFPSYRDKGDLGRTEFSAGLKCRGTIYDDANLI